MKGDERVEATEEGTNLALLFDGDRQQNLHFTYLVFINLLWNCSNQSSFLQPFLKKGRFDSAIVSARLN